MCFRKKVLFLIESMVAGGAERALINLVNSLPTENYDITVCSIFKKSVYRGYDAKLEDKFTKEIKIKYLFDNSSERKSEFWNFILNRFSKRLLHRLFIGSSYDCEVAFYEGLPTEFLSNSSNRKSKKIAWLHTMVSLSYPTDESITKARRWYINYDKIIGVSKASVSSFCDKFGMSDRVDVCYNLLDYERIIRKAGEGVPRSSKNRITFISVGRICPVKGFDRLIDACAKLCSEGYLFDVYIIGGGIDYDKLDYMIRDYNISDSVHLLGYLDNPYRYMVSADCYICSSVTEGYGLSILEAIVLGLPIISVDFPAVHEVLDENRDFSIITENSTLGIYNAMKKVLACDDVLAKMRKGFDRDYVLQRQRTSIDKIINVL